VGSEIDQNMYMTAEQMKALLAQNGTKEVSYADLEGFPPDTQKIQPVDPKSYAVTYNEATAATHEVSAFVKNQQPIVALTSKVAFNSAAEMDRQPNMKPSLESTLPTLEYTPTKIG
jgi:hypothetical protein